MKKELKVEPLKGSTEEPLTEWICALCGKPANSQAGNAGEWSQRDNMSRDGVVSPKFFHNECIWERLSASPLEPLHETPLPTNEEIEVEVKKRWDSGKAHLLEFHDGVKFGAELMRSRLLPSNPESPSNEWIPVSERLPEIGVQVLVFYTIAQTTGKGKDKKPTGVLWEYYEIAFVNTITESESGKSAEWITKEYQGLEPLFWMPLPSKP